MMKNIIFDYEEYNDNTIFDMIIDGYNMDKEEKNINVIWKDKYWLSDMNDDMNSRYLQFL
jgi:hypothetical protein